ncbi:MAG: dethiobiotin synthase [Planctomycetota bacterium]|jgi:dethiobiotin synthetase
MAINLDLPTKPGLFIIGTEAGVGKTVIAGAIARILAEKNVKVGVFKPIATGGIRSWDGIVSKDSKFLAWSANSDLPLSTINPQGFIKDGIPLSAAFQERRNIDFEKISKAYRETCQNCDIVIVEGVGGTRVPLTNEFDLLDLAAEFHLPVILVVRHNTEVINHALMSADCIRSVALKLAGIVSNGFNSLESKIAEDNAENIIEHYTSSPILSVVPFDEQVDIENPCLGEFIIDSLVDCKWEKLTGYR